MVVEDHDDTRAILRAILGHHGFEVGEVESAEEMFERIHEFDPDLVVLDVRLPGMTGCEALNNLRQDGFSKPVFLFSEYFDILSDDVMTCAPDGFFSKSKGPLPLLEGIRERLMLDSGAGSGALA
jgi:CheY-like chemotaxis protein